MIPTRVKSGRVRFERMTTLGRTRPQVRSLVAALTATGVMLAGAVALSPGASAGSSSAAKPTPSTIALPDGWQPEGIATGTGGVGYVGSLADGSVYTFDLRTGKKRSIIEGPGTPTVGLDFDRRNGRLYAAGGDAGTARIINTRTEETIADYTLTTGPAFVNDVIVTKKAAWFTNSAAPELFRVPITKKGKPAPQGQVRTVPLTGDWTQPEGFGANGITRTPDGTGLLVVNSADGTLFRVETKGASAGSARQVDLGEQSLTNGDGMLARNRTLYVVRNRLNEVVELTLDKRGLTGRAVDTRTSAGFDVPTTIAAARGRFYLPNARFGTEPTPTTTYTVSVLKKR